MLAGAEIAVARGSMPGPDRDMLAALIAKMGPLPAVGDVPIADVLEAIALDKRSSPDSSTSCCRAASASAKS
jgi:hypothetical protein